MKTIEQQYQAPESDTRYRRHADAALKNLADPLSLHCWQADDVRI
jgi:L-rhamnose isomerase